MELGDFGAGEGVGGAGGERGDSEKSIRLRYITAASLWGMIGATEERICQNTLRMHTNYDA